MFSHTDSSEPVLRNGRKGDPDPASLGATQGMSGVTYVAIIDGFLQVLALAWFVAVCGLSLSDGVDGVEWLALAPLLHWIVILSACCCVSFDVLLLPMWFVLAGFGLALVDLFVVVQRSVFVFSGAAVTFGCDFVGWLFATVFLALALSYALYGLVVLTRFGHYHLRPTRGRALVAIIDIILFALLLVILFFLCGSGTFPDTEASALSLWHAIHLVLVLSTWIACLVDSLLVPAWFILWGLVALGVDGVILLLRSQALLGDGGTIELFDCDFFLWFFDIFFLFTAIGYIFYAARSGRLYGLCGDPDDAGDPLVSLNERPPEDERTGRAKPDALTRLLASAALGKSPAKVV